MKDFVVELRPFNIECMQVVNIYFFDDVMKLPSKYFLSISTPDALRLKKYLNSNLILINKKVIPKDPHLPFPEVTFDMFSFEDSSFELRKLRCLTEVSARVNYELTIISCIELLEYFVIVSSFAEKGIIITDTNREEKYLEIVSSSDEGLIDMLEKYLSLKKVVDGVYQKYRNLMTTRDAISASRNEEELNNALLQINANEGIRVKQIIESA